MQGVIRFIKVLVLSLLLSCAINTLLMELHLVPKVQAARTGTLISGTQMPKTAKIEKGDVQYPDFWIVDQVPC